MINQTVVLRNPNKIRGTSTLVNINDNYMPDISNPLNKQSSIIAVTSGKGGVGKSTLCVNLGISLAQMGMKVLLLDCDFGLANINVLMGIIPDHSIYDVIRGKKRLRETIISTSFGLDIIAGANGISQLADINHEQRDFFLEQLDELGDYNIILIDTGAGIGANVVSLALASDEILVVTTPEPTAITDAYAMIKSIVIHELKKPIRLLINRVPNALEAKRVSDRLSSIALRFLGANIETAGFIYEEDLVQKSVRAQRPLINIYPTSKSANCISNISALLLNRKEVIGKSGGLKGFFKNLQNILGINESNVKSEINLNNLNNLNNSNISTNSKTLKTSKNYIDE